MRKFLGLIGFLTLFVATTSAQMPAMAGGRGGAAGAGQNMNIGHFYGKIVDSKTNKGIEGVTVQLRGNKFDTVTKKMKEAILGTIITKTNGDFSFENLSLFGNFKLNATALAYKTVDQTISFGIKMPSGGANGGNMQQMLGMADKDLGNIKMEEDATNLGNVTVTASTKPQFELGIDRKIFNVDKNLMGSGQTATELMRNIPALNVDIDGNVTLRNAAPTLFIDGRPTTITLDQIPSDIIDRVELITNPSAKFDASGGNAGILNIVLKKNKKVGYNGGLRMGIDSRGRINGGGDINIRQNKLNFTGSGVLNQRKSISEGITDRNNILAIPSNIYNLQNSTNQGYFGFFRGGLDYFVDNRNTLSVTANFNRGQFDNDQTQRVDSTIKGIKSSYSNIGTQSTSNFRNVGTQLSYKHNFMKNGHNISSDYNYNKSSNDNLSNINNYTYNLDGTQKGIPILQRGIGEGSTTNHTFQIDYENPLTDDKKFEAGGRVAIRDFNNKLDQFRFNSLTGQYELVPLISSRYKYTDAVYAAYSTYSFRVNKWSYQLGLRAESSNYTGTLLNSKGADSASFSVKFPLSLFPSAFITYKIDEKQDFQINYSRRVNRPNFFQLMPFPDYSDPQNINMGNAGLKPEFTNSFEMSWNNAYKKGANFLATAFFKHSTNLITRYVYRDANALVPGDSAFFSTFINANSARSFGLELTNKMSVTSWWEMTVNLNIFNSRINATVPGQPDLVQEQWSWFTKMNNTFKVAKGLSIQLSGDYQAKTVLPQSSGGGGRGGMMWGGGPQSGAQGYNLPRYGFDLAIRKEFTWKNGRSGNLTLSMNDIFRTQLFQSYSESSFFNQTNQRRRDPQVLRLNFSYRFGKFDASLFKRKNTKADQSGGMDMMQQ
ncbi:outer membrane beta-barrel family protein [Sediminibacterium sp.]|uniref:outer membrane beta-barrel family protein n=1 Tax=Sediminibacterium sp. TaxID=1917865 RepID=UPI0027365F3E|nr:outer membrane beta-barrel family protein [Sediminibacterium sp.]MDP3393649.1 outer membrane beta-barrel family protein [Sediminibacterium sp.]MDP3566578.1 outer membrane beta-barrel family protein [Sediminibacterium sp.]